MTLIPPTLSSDPARVPTVAQFRAARALLDWSQDRLAAEAEVGRATVGDFERGARKPIRWSLRAMRQALEAAGIVFLWTADGGEGVLLRTPQAVPATAGASGDVKPEA